MIDLCIYEHHFLVYFCLNFYQKLFSFLSGVYFKKKLAVDSSIKVSIFFPNDMLYNVKKKT